MDWVNKIKKSLINDISILESRLQLYVNLDFESDDDKKNMIKDILKEIIIKEHSLIKWNKITEKEK